MSRVKAIMGGEFVTFDANEVMVTVDGVPFCAYGFDLAFSRKQGAIDSYMTSDNMGELKEDLPHIKELSKIRVTGLGEDVEFVALNVHKTIKYVFEIVTKHNVHTQDMFLRM